MMSKLNTVLVTLLLCSSLSGCSWIHHFVLVNQTEGDVTITYEWLPILPDQIRPIFTENVRVYPTVKTHYKHDPVKYDAIVEKDKKRITLALPKNHSMVFGYLRNDKYKRHNQRFINGTVFNLKQITIATPKKTIVIPKHRFDDFFKFKKGSVKYVVR